MPTSSIFPVSELPPHPSCWRIWKSGLFSSHKLPSASWEKNEPISLEHCIGSWTESHAFRSLSFHYECITECYNLCSTSKIFSRLTVSCFHTIVLWNSQKKKRRNPFIFQKIVINSRVGMGFLIASTRHFWAHCYNKLQYA